MAENTDKSIKMLATALEMEDKGRAYYENAARDCPDELGKEIFELLKDYELVHFERIRVIHEKLTAGDGWSGDWKTIEPEKDLSEVFKKLAGKPIKKIKEGAGTVEAIGIGLEFENGSIEYYKKHLEDAVDPLEKEFLEKLLQEEREHFRILADMRFYYKDPEGWIMEKEKSTLDGA